jgi:hypothetical protein
MMTRVQPSSVVSVALLAAVTMLGLWAPGAQGDWGAIVAWGLNDQGQCNVPAPNTGFVAVAGGYWHSLGLKRDCPPARPRRTALPNKTAGRRSFPPACLVHSATCVRA